MIKRGKFYAPPPSDGRDVRQLFAYAVEKGLGQPVDEEGVPSGQWTPETLAEAISKIDHPDAHVDLRTVQYWFQMSNQRNISSTNCRWLARIFGCGEADAVSDWQSALLAARRLFLEIRAHEQPLTTGQVDDEDESPNAALNYPTAQDAQERKSLSIEIQTMAMFSSERALTLPLVVFAGACSLALIALGLNIHSVIYEQDNGILKQVGFLWAPNWTVVFLAVLPTFLAHLIELLRSWREELRPQLLLVLAAPRDVQSWGQRVVEARQSFLVVFFVTVIIASGYNWVVTHLTPLLDGDPGRWPIDWGRIAIVRPEIVSIPAAIAFSGLVFVYNGFTAYLFFTGHVFLLLLKNDFSRIVKGLNRDDAQTNAASIEMIAVTLMDGIFRCNALGIVITIMMKLQSDFLLSSNTNIVDWLRADILMTFGQEVTVVRDPITRAIPPGSLYSFLCVLAIVGTFVLCQAKIRHELSRIGLGWSGRWKSPWTSMNSSMLFLVLSYFSIGVVPGFSVLVLLSLLLTVYLVSKPLKYVPMSVA